MAENKLEESVVAGHMQSASMGAVVHLSMINTIYIALFKSHDLMEPIATFVSNYVDKKLNCVMKKKVLSG